ncbi:DUF6259 domain-containing protein [Agromyces silvae]|uniref:DUF6259 domain-containing protein n=1 Tax=Agromyces silvae TaxID=3388266 RepID=UPI00280B07A8|nr:DUF6259 domain-containing protein [Agromyces protaetiae]
MALTSRPATAAGGLTFLYDEETGRAELRDDAVLTAERGRFWTLSAVHGRDRDVPVHSEDQRGTVTRLDDGLRIAYETVRTADGDVLDVSVTVEIRAGEDGGLEFSATADAGPGVTVRELAVPIVELAERTASADEVLYRAEGLGRKTERPRARLAEVHTEYMVDDGAGTWEPIAYPGELSMPWQGVERDGTFLYLGRHDPEFSSVVLSAGVPPRGGPNELWLAAVTPSGRAHAQAGPVVLRRFDGTWRDGAAFYRSWAERWYTGPHPDTTKLEGWQRIILRHQFGQINYRYTDLVDLFEEGRRYGLDGILLFGWWKAGFDRGYPDYEPDDELGGAEEFARAIREIRSRGGFISLYANGNLIDRTTPYAAEHGPRVTKKDADGLDYVAGYDFARESQTLRLFSPGHFTMACHGAPEWREKMAEVARLQASLGTEAVFFDQTAYHLAAWPCYDASHEHGERTGIEGRYRAETLRAIRDAAGARSLGSEGMADCMIGHLNYHHGWGFGFQDGPEAFAALFRTVFPEPVVSNRLIQDERVGWEDQLNHAFVHNLTFDVAIHRSRRSIEAYPGYAARVGKLIAIRTAHARPFAEGAFRLVDDGPLHHVRYETDTDALDVFWNRTDEPAERDGVRIDPHDVAVRVLEGGDR